MLMCDSFQRNSVLLAVNGTLMRGLALNSNLVHAGAEFVCETSTSPDYRLYSIDGKHPAMQRVAEGGAAIACEVWRVPNGGVALILAGEPEGLCIGKVTLSEQQVVLGVLGESILCQRGTDITQYGGWRGFLAGHRQS